MAARPRLVGLGALTVVALVLLPAAPAAAHAVLLRTTPAPQSTVKTAPRAVRLDFNEHVDVAFGAIRVFDVDAHRVDLGKIRTTNHGTSVLVPLRPLHDGTYSVTWRAVSADGHLVRGGFAFYVGAPSSISAAALPTDKGAGRLVGWTFGLVRFLWYGGFIVLVGAFVVRRFVWSPAVRATEANEEVAPETSARFRKRFRMIAIGAWVALVVGGALRLGFEAASVSGLPVARAFGGSALGDVLDTSFGHIWRWEIALAISLVVPLLTLTRRRPVVRPDAWLGAGAVLAGALAYTTARNGHARTDPHPLVATISIALHLVAGAVWVGGLLMILAGGIGAWRALEHPTRTRLAREVVVRFSTIAMVAVAVIVVTGTVNSWFDFAAVRDLWSNTYGRTVSAKIILLLIALALAARHRFVVPARLAQGDGREVGRFERSGVAESVILVAVIAVAAGLVAMVPGRSLAAQKNGPVNLEQRVGSGISVQLFLDDTASPPQIHLTFVDAGGIADAGVANATAVLHPPGVGAAPQTVALRLLSPGHFVGDVTLAGPGRYAVDLTGKDNGKVLSTTVRFNYRGTAKA